jgi:hypothetical protein
VGVRIETQPGTALPEYCDPLRILIYPRKDVSTYDPSAGYDADVAQFWYLALSSCNWKLSQLADGTFRKEFDPPCAVTREYTDAETSIYRKATNASVREILNTDPRSIAIEFLSGAMEGALELYNSPFLHTDARRRIHLVSICGTKGAHVGAATIDSDLPVEPIRRASLIVAHDDVGDSMAHLAEFIQRVMVIKKIHSYNGALVKLFSEKLSHEDLRDPYKLLIGDMRKAGIVAAIPFYKNTEFVHLLKRVSSDGCDPWDLRQSVLTECYLECPSDWLMGNLLDTDATGEDLWKFLSTDIRRRKITTRMFPKIVLDSKIRIGATVGGLIALRDSREHLLAWVAKRIEEQLIAVDRQLITDTQNLSASLVQI